MDTPVESGPGALLRQARERAGLSLEAAANELLLKPRLLDALEHDRLDELPEPPFVRGYLRSFARLVGVDEADVLERYEALLPEQPEVTFSVASAKPEDRNRLALLGAGSVAVLAAVAVLVWWIGSDDTVTPVVEPEPTRDIQETEIPPSPSAAVAVPAEEPPPVQQAAEPETAPVEATPTVAEPEPEVESASEPVEAIALPSPAPEEASVEEASVEEASTTQVSAEPVDVVSVEMLADSWIEVYDSQGRRLLYGLEPAGRQHELRGTRPFRVFLGNAPGVEVEINGRPFDLSPLVRRDNTARFTLK